MPLSRFDSGKRFSIKYQSNIREVNKMRIGDSFISVWNEKFVRISRKEADKRAAAGEYVRIVPAKYCKDPGMIHDNQHIFSPSRSTDLKEFVDWLKSFETGNLYYFAKDNSVFYKSWKIYGYDSHRQKQSFNKSFRHDFSKPGNVRIVGCFNSDMTDTNEYSIFYTIRNSEKECEAELSAQLSDGIFKNSITGKIEVFNSEKIDTLALF